MKISNIFKAHEKQSKKPTKGEAIFIMISCFLIATLCVVASIVFMEDDNYERSECKYVETHFVSYETHSNRTGKAGRTWHAVIYCIDGNKYEFDTTSFNRELKKSLSALYYGQPVSMLLEPKENGKILEFSANGEVIVSFEQSMDRLSGQRILALGLGVAFYALSAYGLYHIIRIGKEKRSRKSYDPEV